MTGDGSGCGFVFPPEELERHTCICREGYMNIEGTLIPGSIIKQGHALDESNYQVHKGCKQCAIDPLNCSWRRQRLDPPQPADTILAPPNGPFEFFLPGEDIHEDVLRAFLARNNGGDTTCLPERRFEGENGFFVRSSFRFNTQDRMQLKTLTRLRRNGSHWQNQLKRASPPSRQPFNEFTSFVKLDTPTSFVMARTPATAPLAPRIERTRGTQEQYGPEGTPENGRVTSVPRYHSAQPQDVVSRVTSQARRMTISGTTDERAPEPIPYSRQSEDGNQDPTTLSRATPTSRQIRSPARRLEGTQPRNESERSFTMSEKNEDRYHSAQVVQAGLPEDRTPWNRLRSPGQYDRGETDNEQQPEISRPGPGRRNSTYRESYGSRNSSEPHTRSRYSTSGARQDDTRSPDSGPSSTLINQNDRSETLPQQRDSSSGLQGGYSSITTTTGHNVSTGASNAGNYSGPNAHYGPSIRSYSTAGPAYGAQVYGAPVDTSGTTTSAYGAQTYGSTPTNYVSTTPTYNTTPSYSSTATAYSSLPRAPTRTTSDRDRRDNISTQAPPPTDDFHRSTTHTDRLPSHATRRASPEPRPATIRTRHPQTALDDDKSHTQRVKCAIATTDIDLEVLAFYLKYSVDSSARLSRESVNGRDVFVVEASRRVTAADIDDVKRDTRLWQRERNSGATRMPYRNSETAQNRKRASGAP